MSVKQGMSSLERDGGGSVKVMGVFMCCCHWRDGGGTFKVMEVCMCCCRQRNFSLERWWKKC